MRHTGAGLAIPDFPLMFGGIVPDHWRSDDRRPLRAPRRARSSSRAPSLMAFAYVWSHHRGPARADAAGGAARRAGRVQVTLGALTVLSPRNPWINSFHVVCGALVLTTSLVLTLRSWRVRFAGGAEHAESAEHAETENTSVSAVSAASAVKRGGARA